MSAKILLSASMTFVFIAFAVADECSDEPCLIGTCQLDCSQGFVDASLDDCVCEQDLPEPVDHKHRIIWDGGFTSFNSQPCDGPGGRWDAGWNHSAGWIPGELEFRTTREVESSEDGNGYLRVGHAIGFSDAGPASIAKAEVTGLAFGVLPCHIKSKADGAWHITAAFRSRRVSEGCASVRLTIGGQSWAYEVECEEPEDDCDSGSWKAHRLSIPINQIAGQADPDDVIQESFWSRKPVVTFQTRLGNGQIPELNYDDLEITLTVDDQTTMAPLPGGWCNNLAGQNVSIDCENIVTSSKSICCSHWNGGGTENWILPESCAADVDGNCLVDVDDLLALISNFDGSGEGDLNCDGIVEVDDLLQLLDAYGDNCCS
ncbi:MAG: hypothetical protein MK089_00060 [Phycisphaerales bacterium]|nr:hypothetical protein [Phycisphaerales bacterium]